MRSPTDLGRFHRAGLGAGLSGRITGDLEVIHLGEKRAIGRSGLAWFDLLQNQVFPVGGIIALDSLLDSDVSGKMK